MLAKKWKRCQSEMTEVFKKNVILLIEVGFFTSISQISMSTAKNDIPAVTANQNNNEHHKVCASVVQVGSFVYENASQMNSVNTFHSEAP